MKSRRRARSIEEPTAPAIVRDDHAQDRVVSQGIGSAKAWRRRSVLEIAYERGQLDDGEGDSRQRAFRAKCRLDAGEAYTRLFIVAQSSMKDSTNLDRIVSMAKREPLSARQAEAIRTLAGIERRMGERDRKIVRMICGENFRLNEAVIAACGGGYRHSVTLRFREALDALIEALEATRHATRIPASPKT